MNQKNQSAVVRLRPMGEMLKRKQREPVIAGGVASGFCRVGKRCGGEGKTREREG